MNYKLTLTALEPEDLDLLYTIENDTDQWHVTNTTVPYSRFLLHEYITSQHTDIYADRQLRLVVRVDGEAVGLIDLFNYEPRHNRAEMGLAILRRHQGRGYATEAIRQLQHYCRSILHLHQLYCIVPADNHPSLQMLRTTGFTHETLLPQWLLSADGHYADAVQLHCIL